MSDGRLFYGDNLDVLRESVATESVDLVYLDPPFNSNKNYNVIFARADRVADSARAQIHAFEDTWRWSPTTDEQYREILSGSVPNRVSDVLRALHTLLGENDAMAYLVNMTPRLVELHRTLKRTGSLYLHCDPTMSHYLKILLDAIFGAEYFRNEIVWHYNTGGKGRRNFLRKHDIILWYSKSADYQFNRDAVAVPRSANTAHLRRGVDDDGREYYEDFSPRKSGKQYRWYLDEGVTPMDVWTDIQALNPMAGERLGYPTQKPLALLERIINASTMPGDVVLDPFCGCGTAIDAAVKLGRPWMGIDVTYLAVDLIRKRLLHRYGPDIAATYEVTGIPRDVGAAKDLFRRSPFDFERWAVSLVNGTPNQKQVGDRGIDGVVRFFTDTTGQTGRVLVSVKGGKNLGPQYVRDLVGTVQTEKAEMGSLLTLSEPTRGIHDAVAHAGTYHWPVTGTPFPRAQVLTIDGLLSGKRLQSPPPLLPYIAAGRHKISPDQLTLI